VERLVSLREVRDDFSGIANMIRRHACLALQRTFAAKPYQGVSPESARYLFVGLDANYDAAIEDDDIFSSVLDYLDDGVAFWKKTGVHHPFLLPGYSGNGKFYHRTFARIGFRPEDASKVCFIELTDVPTYGQSKLDRTDLNPDHLRRLNQVIVSGAAKVVFLPDRVGKLMKASGEFPWMPAAPKSDGGALKTWYRDSERTVYWHYHFSSYGTIQRQKNEQLAAMRMLVAQEEARVARPEQGPDAS
jgi:hypothetical protein